MSRKIIFKLDNIIVAVINIENKTVEEVERIFNLVFKKYPSATFEYV